MTCCSLKIAATASNSGTLLMADLAEPCNYRRNEL